MADIQENQMITTNNPKFLRCIDSAGNSNVVDPKQWKYPNIGAEFIKGDVETGKWYRIAKGYEGESTSSGLFNIGTRYNNSKPYNILFYAFAAGYNSPCEIKPLSVPSGYPISKARVLFKNSKDISYLDIYVTTIGRNSMYVSASCLIGFQLQNPEEVSETIDEGYSSKEVTFT